VRERYLIRVGRRRDPPSLPKLSVTGTSSTLLARGRATASYQKPSPGNEEKRKATATPLTRTTTPTELVWDGSWFSGSSSMEDPFCSGPLESLVSVTVPSGTHDVKVSHRAGQSPTAPSSMVPNHPYLRGKLPSVGVRRPEGGGPTKCRGARRGKNSLGRAVHVI
jgi:hypothetical protein